MVLSSCIYIAKNVDRANFSDQFKTLSYVTNVLNITSI